MSGSGTGIGSDLTAADTFRFTRLLQDFKDA
jgi:hypothetical protein